MAPLLLLLACTAPGPSDKDSGFTLGEGPDTLTLPDLSGIDLPAAYVAALELASQVTLSAAWTGHLASIGRRSATCPDLYVGAVEDAELDMDATGLTWSDYCQPSGGGAAFSGWTHWDGTVQVDGDPADAAGQTVDASRELSGDSLVSLDGEAAFELRGEASESVYRVTAPDYQAWTWSSLVDATVTGSDAFGADQGWRASMYLAASGGEAPGLELRGNAYLFSPRIAGRFDSVEVDLTFSPDDTCSLEPRGWLSLRDEDAFWYDLVFMPAEAEGGDTGATGGTDLAVCDGCGTLYIRGLETVEYGEVCPDLSGWAVEDAAVPDPGAFLLTLREVLAMEGG